VACLEQLVWWLIEKAGLDSVQPSICSLPAVDSSLTNALGCYSGGTPLASCQEGLASYINSVRRDAPEVLITYPV
jgi:hypothetical protein